MCVYVRTCICVVIVVVVVVIKVEAAAAVAVVIAILMVVKEDWAQLFYCRLMEWRYHMQRTRDRKTHELLENCMSLEIGKVNKYSFYKNHLMLS